MHEDVGRPVVYLPVMWKIRNIEGTDTLRKEKDTWVRDHFHCIHSRNIEVSLFMGGSFSIYEEKL
jgi:hypothetical protein